MKLKPPRLAICVAAALAVCLPTSGVRAGGAATGGATEFTQILNNAQLLESAATQAAMVSEQIVTKINTINQYIVALQNLHSLPAALLAAALAPYRQQIDAFSSLLASVNAVKSAADNTAALVQRRGSEADAMKMDMRTYLKNEVALAKLRGGIYRQRVLQDIAAINALAERSNNLRTVADRTASVTGNVEGLQNLSQISTMAAAELMEIKAVALAQSADRNQERAANADAQLQMNSAVSQAAAAGQVKADRNAQVHIKVTPPWGAP